MLIRKLFKFENAHIVRDCTTQRCSENIHGHSYKIEVLLESVASAGNRRERVLHESHPPSPVNRDGFPGGT